MEKNEVNNRKINKTKSWFFDKICEFDKPCVRFNKKKKKKDKTQVHKIRNEHGGVSTDNAEMQRIIRDYYK